MSRCAGATEQASSPSCNTRAGKGGAAVHSNMVHRSMREQRERHTAVAPAFVSLPVPTGSYIPAVLYATQAAPDGEQPLPDVD